MRKINVKLEVDRIKSNLKLATENVDKSIKRVKKIERSLFSNISEDDTMQKLDQIYEFLGVLKSVKNDLSGCVTRDNFFKIS